MTKPDRVDPVDADTGEVVDIPDDWIVAVAVQVEVLRAAIANLEVERD